MEGLFLGGSLLAAFLAGAVALFAPCCIVVMFPAYLAAAVRNSRWRLVPLTLVFAAGIAVVLVPVTLGLGMLTRGLLRYHSAIYLAGGLLMVALAILALTGRGWVLPIMKGSPDIQRTDSGGVFVLGVFSGAASACCAPVLAGVLTLSAVAPSLAQGVAIGLAYVFGMVFPLFIMALAWDRFGIKGRTSMRGRFVSFRFLSRSIRVTVLDLVAAGMFGLMGLILIGVGLSGETLASDAQASIGSWIQERMAVVAEALEPVPDVIVGLLLVGFGIGAVAISGRSRRRTETARTDSSSEEQGLTEGSCHDEEPPSDTTPKIGGSRR